MSPTRRRTSWTRKSLTSRLPATSTGSTPLTTLLATTLTSTMTSWQWYLAGAVDSTGQPVAKRSEIGRFSWDTRNLKSAQKQFPDVSRPEMTSQLRGSVQTRVAEEREIAQAQIRTMLDEQRRILTAECSEKVLHHELLAAHAEQDRKILHEELRQHQEFREGSSARSYEASRIAKIPEF